MQQARHYQEDAMSHNPFEIPAKPAVITLDTLPQLFAHHRARFGGARMSVTPPEPEANTPPERPEGVTEEEWGALNDPGKAAIARERAARAEAERALAASRARPAPPKQPTTQTTQTQTPADGQQPADIEAIVQRAVEAAVKPFQEREEQRDAAVAVQRIQEAVATAAKDVFHDTSDAVAGIDLTKVTDGNGNADLAKIKTELDNLLKSKPHLGKVPDGRLYAQPGFGAGETTVPLETRVQGILARMNQSAGIKAPAPTT